MSTSSISDALSKRDSLDGLLNVCCHFVDGGDKSSCHRHSVYGSKHIPKLIRDVDDRVAQGEEPCGSDNVVQCERLNQWPLLNFLLFPTTPCNIKENFDHCNTRAYTQVTKNPSYLHFVVTEWDWNANDFSFCHTGKTHLLECTDFGLLKRVHITRIRRPSQRTIHEFHYRCYHRCRGVTVPTHTTKNPREVSTPRR